MGEPKRDGSTRGTGLTGASAAPPGTLIEGGDAAESAAEFCPIVLLEEAGAWSVAGVTAAGAEDVDCSDGGRVLDAVGGDRLSEVGACRDSLEGVSEGMAGLPPLIEADCKDEPGANGTSGTRRVSVDLLVSAGVDAGTLGLELARVLCTGTPETCGLATAVGMPAVVEVTGKGLSGEVSVVGEDAIGIISPVTMDARLTGAAGLLEQEGVL